MGAEERRGELNLREEEGVKKDVCAIVNCWRNEAEAISIATIPFVIDGTQLVDSEFKTDLIFRNSNHTAIWLG